MPGAQLELPDDLIHRLDTWFDAVDLRVPSLSFAVFDRGGVLHHRGIGEFRLDGRGPSVGTVYRIASMSKSFCIACVLILEERGQVDLDEPVSTYVPEFPDFADTHGTPVPVTVRMLMTNCSGLPEDNAWADFHLGIARRELLSLLSRGLRYSEFPGCSYQYSNIGFAVLGLIVENVTGRPFIEFAETELLGPLGLSHTHYSASDFHGEGPDGGAPEGIAHGYSTFDSGATWLERPFVGTGALACAGSIFSTLGDIARWSAWLSSAFDPGNVDDSVLSRAQRRRMQRIHTAIAADDRVQRPTLLNVGYGMGLIVEQDSRFGTFAQHSGGLPGFGSNMRWHVDSGVGVVLFTNTEGQKTARWTMELLEAVLSGIDVPAREITLWPETAQAARRVDEAVLGRASIAECADLFSPNVLSDAPADVRDARIHKLIEGAGGLLDAGEAGRLEDRLSWSASAAQVVWRIPCRNGGVQGRLEMTEVSPPRIQRVEIEKAIEDGSGDPDLMTHHFRPLIPR